MNRKITFLKDCFLALGNPNTETDKHWHITTALENSNNKKTPNDFADIRYHRGFISWIKNIKSSLVILAISGIIWQFLEKVLDNWIRMIYSLYNLMKNMNLGNFEMTNKVKTITTKTNAVANNATSQGVF